MSKAIVLHSEAINDHVLKKLVERAAALMKLSMVQGFNSAINPSVYKLKPKDISVGGRTKVKYPSLEGIAAERFQKLDQTGKKATCLALGRDASITAAIRELGIDMRSDKPVLKQLDLAAHFPFINGDTFNEDTVEAMLAGLSILPESEDDQGGRSALRYDLKVLESKYSSLIAPDLVAAILGGAGSDTGAAVLNKGVKFRIHEVKCIDETNPEWWGSDEISWGGVSTDDKGQTATIPEKRVGGGFDDGDKKTYNPPAVVRNFPLDSVYPKEFMVCLALAEKDSGGFASFIQKLYDAVKANIALILNALGAAAGAYIGSQIGGSLGTAIGGPLGTIIGVAAGAIVGALVGWLISSLNDDIFEPRATSLFLGTAQDTFEGGGLVSPKMMFHYRDHGGHYRVKYDWAIVR